MQYGRIDITTSYPEITKDNVIDVLQKAVGQHQLNAARIQFLLDYEAGCQPIVRSEPKKIRPDIDNECVDNVASEITTFWLGYQWGNPPMFAQRTEDDEEQPEKAEAIKILNDCMVATNHKQDSQKNGRFVEIGGIGNTYIDVNTDYEEGESYFTRDVLNPCSSFVVKSSYYPDHRSMLGVTFAKDDDGVTRYTCFTKTRRFEIKQSKITNPSPGENDERWTHEERSGEKNPLGRIPIIEWFRSYDRMGVFEKQISECDNLNLLISDFTNDVDQNTQAVFWTNDVEFPKEIIENEDGTRTERVKKPESGEWMQTFTTADGKTPSVAPIAIPYDYQGMLNNIITRRALILQKCNVPVTSDNINGSTGVATDAAFGWTKTETVSNQETMILDGCRMEELKVILAAIRISQDVPQDSPLLNLKYSDVQITTRRAKEYELNSSINFFATAVSHGINGFHALKAMRTFPDPNEVWADSKDTIERFQASIFDKNVNVSEEGRNAPDESDQIENSPNIDGIETKVM